MEVHTPSNPYCDDINCWCHTDRDYHEDVIDRLNTSDDESADILAFHELSEAA